MIEILMKYFKFSLIFIVLISTVLYSFNLKQKYENKTSDYFIRGERLKYKVEFLFLNAGEGIVYLDSAIEYINGNPCYKVEISARTTGMFALASKLKDTWRSYIDTAEIFSHKFYRDLYENGYTRIETTDFDYVKKRAIVEQIVNGEYQSGTYSIPHRTQDIVSAYYHLRTLNFNNYQSGDTICIDTFLEDKNYNFSIKYLGKTVLKTSFGKIRCFVISPIMPNNKIFDQGNSIRAWISDDANRIPLKVKAKLFIGSAQLNLTKYNVLKESFNKVSKK